MYLIAIYIIGFIFCIIANLLFKMDDEMPMLVCLWFLSAITVPIAIFILMLYLIGILINAITKAIRKSSSMAAGLRRGEQYQAKKNL